MNKINKNESISIYPAIKLQYSKNKENNKEKNSYQKMSNFT